jgi:hypothetical protein
MDPRSADATQPARFASDAVTVLESFSADFILHPHSIPA